MAKINQELFRGHVDTIILKALNEEPKYGYEILDIIKSASKGVYEIKQSTLYSTLKRLEKTGLISSFLGDESMGGRRRYYSLTDNGKEYLIEEQRDWEFSRTLLNNLVSDKEIDLKDVKKTFDPNSLRPLTKRNKPLDEEDYYQNENSDIKSSDFASEAFLNNNDDSANNSANNIDDNSLSNNLIEDTPINSDNNASNEQTIIAAKLLNLGDFSNNHIANIDNLLNQDNNNNFDLYFHSSPSNANEKENEKLNSHKIISSDTPLVQNYKDELGKIFNKPNIHNTLDKQLSLEEKNINSIKKAQHFNDLKQSLLLDGYKLKSYNKVNSFNYYFMKYVYSNKLVRDTSYIVSGIYFIFSLFITIFYKKLNIPNIVFPLVLTLIISFVPVFTTIIWNLHPNKRIKAKFNLAFSLIKSLTIVLITIAITIIAYLIQGDIIHEAKRFTFYLPFIYSLFFPFYIIIKYSLFRTYNYHLSNKNQY